jgi:hypothetical protein
MAFLWCAKVLLPCWSVDLLMQTRVVGNHRCGEGHQSLRSVWRPVCKRVCLSRLMLSYWRRTSTSDFFPDYMCVLT